ncbi:hypothetical protein GCM10010335_30910 [Streptomyces galbus]|nr:hypothetical protein GCM10010335_30910 [Streptomyces galbus]
MLDRDAVKHSPTEGPYFKEAGCALAPLPRDAVQPTSDRHTYGASGRSSRTPEGNSGFRGLSEKAICAEDVSLNKVRMHFEGRSRPGERPIPSMRFASTQRE